MIHVLSVKYAGGLSLALQFDDDSSGTADLRDFLERSHVFASLRDQTLFAQAYVEDGTVCWPGELDLSPERLYALAHHLPAPDTLEQANANELSMRAREQARLSAAVADE